MDAAVMDAGVVDAAVVDAAVVDASVADASVVDAAVADAAVADASVVDAAFVDAAFVDAAVVDASVADASVADASVADASAADAAVVDAAVVDAAVADAAVVDAAVPDAAVPDAGVPVPPVVLATSPSDAVAGVAASTAISVTFSKVMAPGTLTTNTSGTSCVGSIQVSRDAFVTCVEMTAAPATSDGMTFIVIPRQPLASTANYKIRVDATVTDVAGAAMAAPFTTATGFTVRYFHTITVDGINDFAANETFASSTVGHSGYVAWDDAYLYLGMNSPDLGGNSNQVWWVAYVEGRDGANAGVTYNTQQPLLPFRAKWHLRYRASDDFGGTLEWNGSAWANAGFGPVPGSGDVATSGSFVEMRVAWADVGSPALLGLHMGMLREQAFNEASWAGIPAGSYVDSYDPNYTSQLTLDVLGSLPPLEQVP